MISMVFIQNAIGKIFQSDQSDKIITNNTVIILVGIILLMAWDKKTKDFVLKGFLFHIIITLFFNFLQMLILIELFCFLNNKFQSSKFHIFNLN